MENFVILLVFIGFIFFIIQTVFDYTNKNNNPKGNSKILPNIDSGWLYVLERDGYIKVGKTDFYKENRNLKSRLEKYINPTYVPRVMNLNLIYFEFFEQVKISENSLKCRIKEIKRNDEIRNFWFEEVYFSPEWFFVGGDIRDAEPIIRTWFNLNATSHESRKWIIPETVEEIKAEQRIFIHNFPNADKPIIE